MSNFVDGSGPIFSMYLEMATEEDRMMVENWKADADGIIIFTGLYSVAVALLVSVSIQDIRPSAQDTSNFYLANIYQTLADPNQSNTSSSLPSSPPTFSPPNYAIYVNAFWFLSLAISLTCGMLAMLLQQWARRYLRVTQPRYSPHKRARIRSFFFEGVEKFFLPWLVEVLPTLTHASLFLFFTGLVVFLCNINLTVFGLVLSWVGACMAIYGCITFIPIFRHDTPYYTPFTSLAWSVVFGALYITFRVLRWFASFASFSWQTYDRFRHLQMRCRRLLAQGMLKTAEEAALNSPSEIDARTFMWTFDSLDEDHELERFFSALPGFRSSKIVDDPLPSLREEERERIFEALIGLLDRSLSSDILPQSVKYRRAIICAKAIDPEYIPRSLSFSLHRTLLGHQYSGPLAAEIVRIVRGRDNNRDNDDILDATISMIVTGAQRRDDSWFILASSEMGVPETVLRDYAAQGDSLSLAILIHVIRRQFTLFRKRPEAGFELSKVLEKASKFNIQDTSPELQHDFCALWNQIVLTVQNENDRWMAPRILGPIRNIYIALHQGTDSAPTHFSASTDDWDDILREPSSYPACNVAGHIYDDHASTTFARIAAPVPASLTSPDAPSSFVLAPLHVVESPIDAPPLDNDIYVPGSFHPTPQTTIEGHHIPATSPDPATAGVIQGGIDATRMVPHSIPEHSASTLPTSMASTSPPIVVSVRHVADPRASSDVPDVPSLPHPTPVLDNMLPTESHPSMVAPAAPGPSPQAISAPDLGAVEGEGSARAASREGGGALGPPSASWGYIMAAPDLPPQWPSLPSVTDVATAGPSMPSPDADPGDHPPHPSHGQYDIV